MKISDSNAPEFVRDLIGKTFDVPNSLDLTAGGKLVRRMERSGYGYRYEYLPPLKPSKNAGEE